LRSRPPHESGQASACASGVRRGLPAAASGPSRRRVGLRMAVSTRALVDGFRAIVGSAHAHDDTAAREAAAIDGVVPSLVVAPASTDETAAVVAFAAGERLAIVPRGSGAALEQGAPVERVDLVLDLARLDRIVEYNPDDLTISVE